MDGERERVWECKRLSGKMESVWVATALLVASLLPPPKDKRLEVVPENDGIKNLSVALPALHPATSKRCSRESTLL